MGKGGLIGWLWFFLDDGVVLFGNFEDVVYLVLADHAVDLVVEVVHELV